MTRLSSLTPGDLPIRQSVKTPAELYEAEVSKVTQFQNRAIRKLWNKESPDAE